ncbi:MAG: hypothetical protein RLZZ381_2690 [Cyanobacteriota bacterium]|jgi:hypothetical protein
MSNFLSGIAVVLSILAGILSGFTAYKVFSLEQEVGTLSNSVANQKIAQPSPSPQDVAANTPPQNSSSTPGNISPSPTNSPSIQPGQFVQLAFKDKAQIELLKVKRIKDPDIGTRNVVNVQIRARRLVGDEETNPYDTLIFLDNTTVRNPDTSEVYEAVGKDRSTGEINLNFVKGGASVDAYVWLRVPEGVKTLDLYIPETQTFKNVPIEN